MTIGFHFTKDQIEIYRDVNEHVSANSRILAREDQILSGWWIPVIRGTLPVSDVGQVVPRVHWSGDVWQCYMDIGQELR